MVLSIICVKCDSKDEKIFKEEGSVEILKSLVQLIMWKTIKWIYSFIKMGEENISQQHRLKNLDETRNSFVE